MNTAALLGSIAGAFTATWVVYMLVFKRFVQGKGAFAVLMGWVASFITIRIVKLVALFIFKLVLES